MRTACLFALLAVATGPVHAEPATWVFLEGPPEVHGMRRGDVDGDGVRDLFVLCARRVVGWRGRAEALPEAKPTWDFVLPDDVSFVDLDPARGLLLYGRQGMTRWDPTTRTQTPLPGAQPLAWRDIDGARFATLSDGMGGRILPAKTGVRWISAAGGERTISIAERRHVTAAGPFLEDAATVVVQRAPFWAGRSPAPNKPPGLWVLDERTLSSHGHITVNYNLPARPASDKSKPTGDRQLHDFNGDGLPEVFQRTGDNQAGHYTVFQLPTKTLTASGSVDVPKPVSRLSLAGYQLDPEFTDVNGDGRDDFVITTIALDGANLVRAVASGRVTAETNLFINRKSEEADIAFNQVPDARVQSEVGVKLHFTYAGTIDVKRTFTIVTQGDYDGDGVKDLLIRTAPDSVTVRRGTQAGSWETDGRTVSIPPLGDHPDVEGYADDLDGRPRDELILLYRRAPGGRDRLCVLRVP